MPSNKDNVKVKRNGKDVRVPAKGKGLADKSSKAKQKKSDGAEKGQALDKAPKQKQTKRRRAFCLIYCSSTGRTLVEKRRPTSGNVVLDDNDSSPGTGALSTFNEYGLFGGGADRKETPLQNIQRELAEEIGVGYNFFEFAVRVPNTKTTIFVKIVDKEFRPKLSVESAGYKWVHDFLEVRPLHSVVAQNYSLLRRLLVACVKQVQKERDGEVY